MPSNARHGFLEPVLQDAGDLALLCHLTRVVAELRA